MEWFENIPPHYETVILVNETAHSLLIGAYTYQVRGRAGRWYIVRFRAEEGEGRGARRTKFFTSEAKALEKLEEISE
ncbi:hypothetical protein ACFOY4_01610 [Actinomadura syzygii]|uniref:WGR domain-containing protein n=1 Tax=Actinomadura syzygii TaxID=1427538 RepID=A0A5D0TUN5_9ACTN|nr:hypothetical protein [Actinomadura syzygii]TYC08559.1 hypothetical protein FXF65_37320 [Actinomadura syzygii]